MNRSGGRGDQDRDLVDASLRGDIESFGRLFESHRKALHARARSILHDPVAADDVVQETFLRAWRHLSTFDGSRPLRPWLATIVERLALDVVRRRRDRASIVDEDGIPRADAGPDLTFETVSTRDAVTRVGAALTSLPARQRRALLRRAVDEWSYERIAGADSSSTTTVKSLIARARASLRSACEGMFPAILLAPIRHLGDRTTRMVGRLQAATANLEAGGAASTQPAVTGIVALALVIAGMNSPGPGVDAHAAPAEPPAITAARAPAASPPANSRTAARTSSPPASARQAPIPGPHPTLPEDVFVDSFAPSPAYEQDHTVFMSGKEACSLICAARLFMSRDAGVTWTTLRASGFAGGTLLIPPDFPRDGRIFAMGPRGLQQSDDSGRSFQTVSPFRGDAALTPTFGTVDDRILIASDQGLFWYRANLGSTAPAGVPLGKSYATVTFLDAAGPELYVLGLSARDRDAAIEVRAGQAGWTRTFSDPWKILRTRFSPSFVTDGVVVSFSSARVYRSGDGARTFERVATPWRWDSVLDVNFAPERGGSGALMYVAVEGQWKQGIYRLSDGVWERRIVDVPGFDRGVRRVLALPDGRILVASPGIGIACAETWGSPWKNRCPIS